MQNHPTTRPHHVDYFQIPDELWAIVALLLPPASTLSGPGRPRASDRAALNGIWYVLWIGCQWKAIQRSWFGVSSSVIHERFQIFFVLW